MNSNFIEIFKQYITIDKKFKICEELDFSY